MDKEQKENNQVKLYYDSRKFQGNTFEQNIDKINSIYFGQGLKISDTPFIILDVKDNQKYLSAYSFQLFTTDGKEIKTIYYPENFIKLAFYHNNVLYNIDSKNNLVVFKFEKDACNKYTFTNFTKGMDDVNKNETNKKSKRDKKVKNNIKINVDTKNEIEDETAINNELININDKDGSVEDSINKKLNPVGESGKEKDNFNKKTYISKQNLSIGKTKIDEILIKLKKLDDNKSLTDNYEAIIAILTGDLNHIPDIQTPKKFSKALNFNINFKESQDTDDSNNGYICKVDYINIQVDGAGKIREQINLNKGIVSFEDGLHLLKSYANKKEKGEDYDNFLTQNDFKCPIIYKNFKEDKIKPNQSILYEIKSGFALKEVLEQLEIRIKIIKNCLFNGQDKPIYFIGIVNLLSKNVNQIANEKYTITSNENILIVASVDYEYCGIDVSHEIHGEYLLHKRLDALEKKMDDKFNEVNENIKNLSNNIDEKFLAFASCIKKLHPDDDIPTLLANNSTENINGSNINHSFNGIKKINNKNQ